jgi:GNAT superfamily N-acetyltransferase
VTPTDQLRVWGLYIDGDIVSCATTVEIDDTVAVWDVATRPKYQRRGYSSAILDAIHERFAANPSVRQFILLSSPEGFRLYESRGYEVLDWWQAWSRPRWVLAAR